MRRQRIAAEREPILEESAFTLPEGEPMGVEDIGDALVARERSTFLLTDRDGNVRAGNGKGYGVYHGDTRHLSTYNLTVNGLRPVILLSTAELGYVMEQVMTNPTLLHGGQDRVMRGTMEIRRTRVMGDVIDEALDITNFNPFPVTLHLLYEIGADFADIFDVRGYQREAFGSTHEPQLSKRSVEYAYTGIDGRERRTRVEFDRDADYIDAATALFRLTLPARSGSSLRLRIAIDGHEDRRRPEAGYQSAIAGDYEDWDRACTQIETDNEFFNRVIARSLRDIRMLWSESDTGEAYPAAGTPWFDAPFGRDTCIMSMQLLAYRPDLVRHCLRLLARRQGKRLDPARDEEPGKILHELRFDELSRSGELPYSPYFGSIDSTPLFLLLAASYYEWTADAELMRVLLPSIRAALQWMRDYGSGNAQGYLAYEKRSMKGLVNQGWKDSWDAVVHGDGRLADPPIALVEAQGYAYAAMARLAPALESIGAGEMAGELRERAVELGQRFNQEYWLENEQYYAMALDGAGQPVRGIGTNPTHCLWAGIVDRERAQATVQRVMRDDVFSGWGLRTLSTDNPRFNPLGYHTGTVWPHDNSLAAMGFKMYGFEDELNHLATALFDAAVSFDYFRLPELFGGEARTPYAPPVPYPVACKPQSWAAGAFLLITQAILGLKAEAPAERLRIVSPRLPPWLTSVSVRNLRVGEGRVTLRYERSGDETRVSVVEATGGLDVVVSKRWPL